MLAQLCIHRNFEENRYLVANVNRQHLETENICNRNDMKMFSASDVCLYNLYQIYLDGNNLEYKFLQSFQAM